MRLSRNVHLEKDSFVSIYERNITILATEIFKVRINLAPHQMHKILNLKGQPNYNLRNSSLLFRPLVK